ncbi:MAG: hypothetical protein ACE5I1_06365 [bacterium]
MKRFENYTDADYMRQVFQQNIPGLDKSDFMITGCQVLQTRFKSYLKAKSDYKTHLSVCYRLEITDKVTHSRQERIVFVKAFLGNRSQSEWQKLEGLT